MVKIAPPHIRNNILDFILYCFNLGKFLFNHAFIQNLINYYIDELATTLAFKLEKPLIGLLTLEGNFLNKIVHVLHMISCHGN